MTAGPGDRLRQQGDEEPAEESPEVLAWYEWVLVVLLALLCLVAVLFAGGVL